MKRRTHFRQLVAVVDAVVVAVALPRLLDAVVASAAGELLREGRLSKEEERAAEKKEETNGFAAVDGMKASAVVGGDLLVRAVQLVHRPSGGAAVGLAVATPFDGNAEARVTLKGTIYGRFEPTCT